MDIFKITYHGYSNKPLRQRHYLAVHLGSSRVHLLPNSICWRRLPINASVKVGICYPETSLVSRL